MLRELLLVIGAGMTTIDDMFKEIVVDFVQIRMSKEESNALIKDILERRKVWKDAIREQIIQNDEQLPLH